MSLGSLEFINEQGIRKGQQGFLKLNPDLFMFKTTLVNLIGHCAVMANMHILKGRYHYKYVKA